MRRASALPSPAPDAAGPARPRKSDWATLATLLPYLWKYRGRVLLALVCLVAAKVANVGVPVVLKHIVDALTPGGAAGVAGAREAAQAGAGATQLAVGVLAVPAALLVGYGLLRLSTSLFTELREIVFARVTQSAVREISLQVFRHLHALSLRFHLERQTGGLTRDLERGSRGVSSLVSYTLYSIVPTLVEITLVLSYLLWRYEAAFAVITVCALAFYIGFTVLVTEWRTRFRREMNELDSKANTRAIDSLLNYETVKYFGNEGFEARRYDESLARWMRAAVRSQTSLGMLNIGQSMIIAVAVTLMVWRATVGVVEGRMTLGDLVLVNAFMIQLYVPLNFLGVLYREIKQSLTDMERMFSLLEQNREVADAPDARPLRIGGVPVQVDEAPVGADGLPWAAAASHAAASATSPSGAARSGAAAAGTTPAPRHARTGAGAEVRFEDVHFAYDAKRPILRGLSFTMAPGTTTAVVGASGAGKSTLARLLFRFYDVSAGRILIDGQDLRAVTQASLRRSIGIVPQDTVLFNDTIAYNIAYGRPGAPQAEIEAAARAAQLDGLIAALPAGWDTTVGERGLKLSGGEKQRVAIARMLIKDPPILVLDEATSALDTRNEQAIQGALDAVAANRTTLVIAHRLSTVVEADNILVMERGAIVEQGTHAQLLARDGMYAQMWAAQAQAQASEAGDDQEQPSTITVGVAVP